MTENTGVVRKKIGIVCMTLGLLLLGTALGLLVFNQKENNNAGEKSADILPKLQEQIEKSEQNSGTESLWEVDGDDYIGCLAIPALGLKLPVMSEWSYAKLKKAPCRYFGSAVTDDLVICGHNYSRHFGLLKNLQAGDKVLFTDDCDETILYQVEEIEILQPTEVSRMVESGYDLTLYTCTYGGASRVTVRCNRAEEE